MTVGPFAEYHIRFPTDDNTCLLLTGRNNEGKSTIIKALILLHAAARIGKRRASSYTKYLPKQDTQLFDFGRLIHNYEGGEAAITGVFSNDSSIRVDIYGDSNIAKANYSPYLPNDISNIFGFIPPLGQLAEKETIISSGRYLDRSLDTTLAPRHLRNHFRRYLSTQQFELVKKIISDSWEGIQLHDHEYDVNSGRLFCMYSENRQDREIAWAGQGLQIWFQIITHLVRLLDTSILVLDEPEIFLHTQKQLDLMQTLREYYNGSIIVATHSVELMNDVEISHIIHVKKTQTTPTIKSTKDRRFLDATRSQLGSSFNLIASQFEDVDVLICTESKYDFDVISHFATAFGIENRSFNISLGGFSEYKKSIPFKECYNKFFGKSIPCTVFLDRDYYPIEYLDYVRQDLSQHGIKTVFTPGKETENIFLDRNFLLSLLPANASIEEFESFLTSLFQRQYNDCLGSLLDLHAHFPPGVNLAAKTVLSQQGHIFDSQWNHPDDRYSLIAGKSALAAIRTFFRTHYSIPLPTRFLIEQSAHSHNQRSIQNLVEKVLRP